MAKNILEQRAKLVSDARQILDRAEAEKRSLTADEAETVRRMSADIDSLKAQADLYAAIESEERSIVPATQREQRSERPAETPSFDAALTAYFRSGFRGMNAEQRNVFETRAMSAGTDSAGGYLVPDDSSFANKVIEVMADFSGVRKLGATVITTASGAALPMPKNDDTSNLGAIVAENGSHASGTDLTLSQVSLASYLFSSKTVKVSLQLLQDSAVDVSSYLSKKLGERIGRIQNQKFTVGTGTNEPTGFMVGASTGVTASSNSAISFDNLIDLVHSVDVAYRPAAKFTFSDATVAAVRKLKDSNGQYIWQPSTQAGQPDRLLGYPVIVNNDIADIAASAAVAAFGDFSALVIRDVAGINVVRLDELFIESGQSGFLGFARGDAALTDTAAVKKLVMGA